MKKGIHASNPIFALWQRVILDGRIYELARECRKNINIPENGFSSDEEFNIWYKRFEDKKLSSIIESNTKFFTEKLKEIIPYNGIISETSFSMLMIRFLINNKIEDEYLDLLKNSGMGVKIIKNSKTYNKYGKEFFGEIEDGVYIKLKPFSTIESILKYIEDNKSLIRNSLKTYTENANLEKPKRIKNSSHFKRDSMILALDEYSKKEIEKNFNIKAKYKEMAISLLMKAMGEKRVTSSIVKAVKQRRKIK